MADDPQLPQDAPASDNLSQADIDRMMEAASASAAGQVMVFRATGERFEPGALPAIEPHDFSNPVVIDEPILRLLRQRHEEFAAFVSARLSIFLRLDFNLKLQRVTSLAYRRFTSQVPNPGHVLLFKLEPLAGVGVLDINLRLSQAIVERLLGGKGQAGAPQALSEIEQNLLDDVLLVILEEWCRLWSSDRRLTAAVVGHENGGRYLQTSASDTPMLVLVFEATFGECTERIQIALPYASVDGILRTLAAARLPASKDVAPAKRASAWRPAFSHIPIPLSVEWDAGELSLREIVALRVGTVLKLPKSILRETCVRLGGATKFLGEAGVEDGRLAIRIDQKITTEEV